ncbi:unnamed protein product, partial [Schistosoma curassoni]
MSVKSKVKRELNQVSKVKSSKRHAETQPDGIPKKTVRLNETQEVTKPVEGGVSKVHKAKQVKHTLGRKIAAPKG